MRELTETVGPLASANAAIIAASQAGTANTALTLTSAGVYTLDTFRRIIITSAGNDTGIHFTIVGTNSSGMPVTEALTGASGGAAQSYYDWLTITSITPSGNTAGNVTVGTNGVASTRPMMLDTYGFAQTSIQVDVTGTVNATVQQTLDDCNGAAGFAAVNWVAHPDTTNLVGLSTTVQGNYAYPPLWVRLLLNSGTGSATIKIIQAGPWL
jgi:hypothetical protein